MAGGRDTQMFARLARTPSYLGRRSAELNDRHGFRPPRPASLGPELGAALARVIAEPDADGPRYEFAELLERRGDHPRAEFIRLQLAAPDTDVRRWASEDRQRELLLAHREDWLRELGPWAVRDAAFRRGFVESVSVSGRAFIALGEGLLDAAPIREVRLVAVEPFPEELARCPAMERLSDRGGRIVADRPADESAAAGRPPSVLRLANAGLSEIAVARLLTSLAPGRTHTLDIAWNPVGDRTAAALADCPALAELRVLDLSGTAIGWAGAAAAARSTHLARLHTLIVRDCPRLHADAIELLRGRFGPGLTVTETGRSAPRRKE